MYTKSMKESILIATTNPAKKEYLEWLVEALGFDITYVSQLENVPEAEETGKNFQENAKLKALHYSSFMGSLVIASDGGLIIPALGDKWNSLHTHRFAGNEATDIDRVKELLKLMAPFKGRERVVYLKESVALAKNSRVLFCHEAKSGPRYLLHACDPKEFIEGFWIANLLYYPELKKRYSELSPDERFGTPSGTWSMLKKKLQMFVRNFTL